LVRATLNRGNSLNSQVSTCMQLPLRKINRTSYRTEPLE
jgi:hypothetical protein